MSNYYLAEVELLSTETRTAFDVVRKYYKREEAEQWAKLRSEASDASGVARVDMIHERTLEAETVWSREG